MSDIDVEIPEEPLVTRGPDGWLVRCYQKDFRQVSKGKKLFQIMRACGVKEGDRLEFRERVDTSGMVFALGVGYYTGRKVMAVATSVNPLGEEMLELLYLEARGKDLCSVLAEFVVVGFSIVEVLDTTTAGAR